MISDTAKRGKVNQLCLIIDFCMLALVVPSTAVSTAVFDYIAVSNYGFRVYKLDNRCFYSGSSFCHVQHYVYIAIHNKTVARICVPETTAYIVICFH